MRLAVEVDLADSGELSTASEWQQFLQRQMVDLAGYFRPVVVAEQANDTLTSGVGTRQNRLP